MSTNTPGLQPDDGDAERRLQRAMSREKDQQCRGQHEKERNEIPDVAREPSRQRGGDPRIHHEQAFPAVKERHAWAIGLAEIHGWNALIVAGGNRSLRTL
jgi:hypothetical protein